MSGRAGAAGFTLLELLVAFAILGLLVVGLVQGTRFGLDAWSRQASVLGGAQDLDAVDRTVRSLLAPPAAGVAASGPGLVGRPDRLQLDGLLPRAIALADRAARIQLAVDGDRHLMIGWTMHLVDARTGARPTGTIALVDNVERISFGYWGGTGWQTQWTGHGMPMLIRMHLEFAEGDPRRWPDFVVATVLSGGETTQAGMPPSPPSGAGPTGLQK
jgi:prepilin-type N-terminal cleavage/methylation domain-containing protein